MIQKKQNVRGSIHSAIISSITFGFSYFSFSPPRDYFAFGAWLAVEESYALCQVHVTRFIDKRVDTLYELLFDIRIVSNALTFSSIPQILQSTKYYFSA